MLERGETVGNYVILRGRVKQRKKKRETGRISGKKEQFFSMQMARFIRCAVILIITYSNSTS